MLSSQVLLVCFLLMCGCCCAVTLQATVLQSSAANPAFMLVGGISAPEEMCLSVEGGRTDVEAQPIHLEPCAAAVAAGDGREIWKFQPNGQLVNTAGKKCMGMEAESKSVVLMDCDSAAAAGDGRSEWKVDGSGQLTLAKAGSLCLSQEGAAAGAENVAMGAAASASSTADSVAHGASMAIDGSDSTFWASALDPSTPVTFMVDLGSAQKLLASEISWEYPAKAFTISLSTDGVKWADVYSTDSNILSSTAVPLNGQVASKIKITMNEAHASYGSYAGHAVLGIKSLSIFAARLRTVVEDCAAASRSIDARDKYFQTFVNDFAVGDSKALRSELPSLEAAQASLTATVTELMDVLPKLALCGKGTALASHLKAGHSVSMRAGAQRFSARPASISSRMGNVVEAQNGIDGDGITSMLGEARKVIIAARSALF